jgi:hypothetical protein
MGCEEHKGTEKSGITRLFLRFERAEKESMHIENKRAQENSWNQKEECKGEKATRVKVNWQ